jgi:hypothetical protein
VSLVRLRRIPGVYAPKGYVARNCREFANSLRSNSANSHFGSCGGARLRANEGIPGKILSARGAIRAAVFLPLLTHPPTDPPTLQFFGLLTHPPTKPPTLQFFGLLTHPPTDPLTLQFFGLLTHSPTDPLTLQFFRQPLWFSAACHENC